MKSKPAFWATSRKRIGVDAESGLKAFFRRTCGNKKAQAAARKSLRLPTRNGRYISRIVIGLQSGVQNFSCYVRETVQVRLFSSLWKRISPPPHSRASENQPVHSAANITQVGLIAFFQFRYGAAGIPDFSERLAHRRPVYVALAEINPGVSVFLTLEIFEVDLHDPLVEGPNPVLRIAVEQHVSDVEPCFDPQAVELVDVCGHFERAQKEPVPDFLDGDYDFQIFGKRNKFADLPLRARPSVAVRGLRIHDGGDEQHCIRVPELSVMQRRAHSR